MDAGGGELHERAGAPVHVRVRIDIQRLPNTVPLHYYAFDGFPHQGKFEHPGACTHEDATALTQAQANDAMANPP